MFIKKTQYICITVYNASFCATDVNVNISLFKAWNVFQHPREKRLSKKKTL